MDDFVAFDVETANPDRASICQIGIARFVDGKFFDKWEIYVNPQDYFDARTMAHNRVDQSKAVAASIFPEVREEVLQRLGAGVVIHHCPFDRTAMKQVFAKHNLALPAIRWLDSSCVVKRAWPDLSRRGFGLEEVAGRFGIAYQPHGAAEDARAAGEVFLHAIRESGLSVDEWMVRVGQPLKRRSWNGTASKEKHLDGNPDGPLHGETAIFTGDFSVLKRELEEMAADAGCDVDRKMPTKTTTLLIVGNVDLRKTKGEEKTDKHRKAEELIAKGQDIRILQEEDFRAYVNDAFAGR